MKKIVLMFVMVLMVLTSCVGNKSEPTYLLSETATSPSETATSPSETTTSPSETATLPLETATVKRVAIVKYKICILLENGVKLSKIIVVRAMSVPSDVLFVEPGDTVVYKGNEIVEVKFKN